MFLMLGCASMQRCGGCGRCLSADSGLDPCGPGKSKLDAFRLEIEALLANGSTQKFIAQRYNTTEANLHNWMKKRDIQKPKIVASSDFSPPKDGRGI